MAQKEHATVHLAKGTRSPGHCRLQWGPERTPIPTGNWPIREINSRRKAIRRTKPRPNLHLEGGNDEIGVRDIPIANGEPHATSTTYSECGGLKAGMGPTAPQALIRKTKGGRRSRTGHVTICRRKRQTASAPN